MGKKKTQNDAPFVCFFTGVNINNATVTKADILCTNGIIHAINAVLVPSDIIPPTQG